MEVLCSYLSQTYIRLAMWMFIRSKELPINKHGRAELYCYCAVSFVLMLVKPRMIAK